MFIYIFNVYIYIYIYTHVALWLIFSPNIIHLILCIIYIHIYNIYMLFCDLYFHLILHFGQHSIITRIDLSHLLALQNGRHVLVGATPRVTPSHTDRHFFFPLFFHMGEGASVAQMPWRRISEQEVVHLNI